MSPAPSFTLDIETAVAFRNWLLETGFQNYAEPQLVDPLAELAAAIDGELHDSPEYVAISTSATTFPPTDRDTSAYPRLPVSDECSDTLSEPRSEQAGVERTA